MAKRLLVTDDAVIIREMIKDTLSAAGWEIVGEADNGQTAVELFEQLKPDAMTLDLVMHALKNILEKDPQAKIVVVSALDQKSVLKDAFKLGASDFVVKPFDKQMLVQTLEKVVC